jgi:hypothetical protein
MYFIYCIVDYRKFSTAIHLFDRLKNTACNSKTGDG